ncbi:hypothetical protein I7I53_10549 [Histoplasma capsulatum var. duboisii H88]|uniref:Uncharacterized protein n=1 Tax=Ajellomyces capsulatus (strain H88) TaxID=544711 RepID=A0A8A1L6J0_AJEC8|nr:hypothetical protein I7I53_10549 [Histoplasma capsulatum var. duboisii H88]
MLWKIEDRFPSGFCFESLFRPLLAFFGLKLWLFIAVCKYTHHWDSTDGWLAVGHIVLSNYDLDFGLHLQCTHGFKKVERSNSITSSKPHSLHTNFILTISTNAPPPPPPPQH